MTGFFGKGGAAVNVEVPDGFEARWVDGVLKLVDLDKEKRLKEKNLIDARKDRVMTFMDACEKLGKDDEFVQDYFRIKKALGGSNDVGGSVVAYLRLRIICRALKVGLPDADAIGAIYLPSISLLTSKDRDEFTYDGWHSLKEIPEDCKRKCRALRDCLKVSVSVGTFLDVKMCGPGYRYRGGVPYGLFLPDKGLAWHFGEQFTDIWIEYLYGD